MQTGTLKWIAVWNIPAILLVGKQTTPR